MKVVCVWKEESDYAREVMDFLRDFEIRTGKTIESIDPDTIEGELFVRSRDILEYPAIVAVDDSGKVLQHWTGTPLPHIDEVSYYAQEKTIEM
ncbi:hypothetical protein IJI94_01725 [Candidatus Saccharibacteria bacterium]|nr:hypothetical protein [Candidatus Saccharibacteria bacterium]